MRHDDGTFNHQIFDPNDFLACTFNDIRRDGIIDVLMDFNVWLTEDLIPRLVIGIDFDEYGNISITCSDGLIVQANGRTTMNDIIRQLKGY